MDYYDIGNPEIPTFGEVMETDNSNTTLIISMALIAIVLFITIPMLSKTENEKTTI